MSNGLVLASVLALFTAFGLPVGAALVLFFGAMVEGFSPDVVAFVVLIGLIALLIRHFSR